MLPVKLTVCRFFRLTKNTKWRYKRRRLNFELQMQYKAGKLVTLWQVYRNREDILGPWWVKRKSRWIIFQLNIIKRYINLRLPSLLCCIAILCMQMQHIATDWVAWSASRSVCLRGKNGPLWSIGILCGQLCKNSWTNRDGVWVMESVIPTEAIITSVLHLQITCKELCNSLCGNCQV